MGRRLFLSMLIFVVALAIGIFVYSPFERMTLQENERAALRNIVQAPKVLGPCGRDGINVSKFYDPAVILPNRETGLSLVVMNNSAEPIYFHFDSAVVGDIGEKEPGNRQVFDLSKNNGLLQPSKSYSIAIPTSLNDGPFAVTIIYRRGDQSPEMLFTANFASGTSIPESCSYEQDPVDF